MGSIDEHTVFEAELLGAAMGAQMLRWEQHGHHVIAMDNQAAIQTTREEHAVSGQYLINALHEQMDAIGAGSRGRSKATIRWVPGHKGIGGNERADEEAKKAARGESTSDSDTPISCRGELPTSRTAELQRHHKALKAQAKEMFQRSPRARFAHEIDPTMPSTAFTKLCRGLSRRHSSILIQLRTGHAPLNKYLHKIGKADSPICPACHNTEETVHHFLIQCPEYKTQRQQLEKKLKRGAKSMRTLLSKPKALPPLFRFINETKRLTSTFGNVTLPDPEKG
jgi:ribonuclease HI